MFAEVAVHTPMARRVAGGARAEAVGEDFASHRAPATDEVAADKTASASQSATVEVSEVGDDLVSLGLTFHYRVPPHLASRLQPGHLVWAPFGKQQLQGVVLALVENLPAGVEARALDDLALDDPVLTPAQLELARWLSHTYLAPILDCVLLMLPPGLAQKAEPVLALTSQARAALALEPPPPPTNTQLAFDAADFTAAVQPQTYFPQFPDLQPLQHRLLAALQRRDYVPLRIIEHQAPELTRPSVLAPLIERGLVSRQRRIVEPPLRPKTGKQVALLANRETIDRLLPTLGRASKQADALAWLAGCAGATATLADLCAAVGCTAAPVRSLAKRGWVAIDAQQVVTLVIPTAEVDARLIELRGGEKYRRVLELLSAEEGPVWVGWLYAEANTDLATLRELAAAGLISLSDAEVWRDPLAGKEFVADKPPALTEDQARVWAEIEAGIDSPLAGHRSPSAYLLHGVTGSGKTEIYLRAIHATLAAGRQAIVLVPEIALTPQTVRRFAARFGERVTVYHSGLSIGERYDVWRRVRSGAVDVIVGTRSALFLPLPRLGLIVLDEEHDPSYKESQRPPRYHARAAALHLARLTGAIVILGSATPALETYYAAQLGQLQLLELPRRIMGHAKAIAEQQARLHLPQTVYQPVRDRSLQAASEARYTDLPTVQVIDLRQELRAGNRSMFSRALQKAMDEVLAAGQQAILFLNRRGTATFIMCRDCGHVLTCEYCNVPLTFHEAEAEPPASKGFAQSQRLGLHATPERPRGEGQGRVICHHCGRRAVQPERCPECGSRRIRYLGAGTEKIADLVQTLWPAAKVVRWDRDVTGHKGSHDAILAQFVNRQANVMVGTQMIAKGLDLPMVTLVGVINADVGLYLPDFRAAERSFQVLTQVAGRAGRSLLGGRVIIQSYRPEHYAIQAARLHDYGDFYRQEISFRRQLGYPPFRRLARMIYLHGDRARAQAEAEAMARSLRFLMRERGLSGADLIGPAPCFFGREGGNYRWQILVRAADPVALLRAVAIPQGWRVDVDPVSVL